MPFPSDNSSSRFFRILETCPARLDRISGKIESRQFRWTESNPLGKESAARVTHAWPRLHVRLPLPTMESVTGIKQDISVSGPPSSIANEFSMSDNLTCSY